MQIFCKLNFTKQMICIFVWEKLFFAEAIVPPWRKMNFSWGILFSQILNQKTPFPIRKHFLIKRKASSIYLPGKKSLVLKGGIGITIMLGKVLRFGLFLWVVAIIMAAVFPLILWIGFSFWQNIFPGLIVKKSVSNQDFTGLLLLSLHFRKSIMLW